jgi:hypothetical protein
VTTATLDEARVEEFLGKVIGDFAGAMRWLKSARASRRVAA